MQAYQHLPSAVPNQQSRSTSKDRSTYHIHLFVQLVSVTGFASDSKTAPEEQG